MPTRSIPPRSRWNRRRAREPMTASGPRGTNPPGPTDEATEVVELTRAGRSSDLWTALETAQAGRVFLQDQPADRADEEAVTRLDEVLDRAVESWAHEGLQNKAPLLGLIDDSLAALAPRGMSLYWGCIERRVVLEGGENVPMQVAVLAVSHSSAPRLQVVMPLQLDATDAVDPGEG